ncbi:MAG TPA: hypothetical protein P5255_12725, partial [Phycisphaerae bacterium]|nr:hypothetical protein [Phycisphaerae bacterium]
MIAPGRWLRRAVLLSLGWALVAGGGCVLPLGQPPVRVWAAGELEGIGRDSPVVAENEIFSAARQEIRLIAA